MSGNINFNGWINDDGSENYKCRAWVNFNGQNTVAIRASGNVSSITDTTTGAYTINFTNPMTDTSFAVAGSAGTSVNSGIDNGVVVLYNRTTNGVSVYTRNVQSSGGTTDYDTVNIAIFR